MKQTNIFTFVFVLLLVLSFASATFISPVSNSHVIGSLVLFNISVDSSIIAIEYNGETVCAPVAGYCSFSIAGSEFTDGALNTAPFDFKDGGVGFSDSVSFYYDTVAPTATISYNITTLTNGNVLVTLNSSEAIQESLTYVYSANTNEVLTITDLAGNTGSVNVVITNIDKVAPNLTLNGSDIVNMTVGGLYTEFGATANDSISENLTANITIDNSSLDVSKVGIYNVTYSVSDAAGNSVSVNRTVIVNALPVIITTSGGSGGGSCTTQWIVSEWSDCIDGVQTRTVSYTSGFCTPRSQKPVESQSCSVQGGNSQDSEETEREVESSEGAGNFVSGITAAAIGTTAGRWSLGIVVFLILLGLVWLIVSRKRKNSSDKKVKKK